MEIFIVAGLAFLTGLFLIFLAGLADRRTKKNASTDAPAMGREVFEEACLRLVEEGMKLEILQVQHGQGQLDILARNQTPLTGGDYLIRGLFRIAPIGISSLEVMEFSNVILQERLSKGILFTTTTFPPDLQTIGELAPMEFVDGRRFESLLREHRIVIPIRSSSGKSVPSSLP